jgi:mono/diheme cytochrome c family protein
VTVAEAAHLPDVITVPTAGIRERTNFSIPRWLTGLLIIVPLFALFALGGSSTGACGEATELGTDVITGEIVNCDGSEFTGGGAGGGATDFIAMGGDIYNGTGVGGVNCASCHGANGEGGAGPALGGVLTTFGACPSHIEWVSLGSGGYPDGYGDTNKPTGGGMPPFGGSLSEEQIAAVAAFERVRFGGQAPEEALADCGLAEEEGAGAEGGEGEGDGTTGTSVPTEGGETTETTVPAEGGDGA